MNKQQKRKALIKLFIKRYDEKQIREIHLALNRAIENYSHVIDKKPTHEKENPKCQ
jgi:hypothetical protein